MTVKNYFFQLAFIALFLGCVPSHLTAQTTFNGSFSSSGQSRSYLAAVPSNSQGSLNLVLLFCGLNEDTAQMALRGFHDYLGNNTMVVYPQPNNALAGFGNQNGVDDFQMVEDLITELAANHNLDLNNIFVGGFSNGAIFTYRLVCDFNSSASNRAYVFKAFAVVSGAMEQGTLNTTDCPASTTPHIVFHGTQDPIINYSNAGLIPPPLNLMTEPVDSSLQFWTSTINNCNASPTVSALPDLVTEVPNSTVERHQYSACTGSPNSVFYKINGGLHAWPGGNANLDIAQSRNQDINASELIANFFANTNTVSLKEVGSSALGGYFYPNPAKAHITLEFTEKVECIEIISLNGQVQLRIEEPAEKIDVSQLKPGMYFLRVMTKKGHKLHKMIKK